MRRVVLFFTLILSFAAPLYAVSETILFDGALELRPEGLYTYIYAYYHPKTASSVFLIGLAHEADEDYYLSIGGYISRGVGCSVVLFEGPLPDRRTSEEVKAAEETWVKELFQDDIDRAFLGAFFAHRSQKIRQALGLVEERTAFDYSQKNWVSADSLWYAKLQTSEFWRELYRQISLLPKEVKVDLVNHTREMFRLADEGKLIRGHLIEEFKLLYGNRAILDVLYSVFLK